MPGSRQLPGVFPATPRCQSELPKGLLASAAGAGCTLASTDLWADSSANLSPSLRGGEGVYGLWCDGISHSGLMAAIASGPRGKVKMLRWLSRILCCPHISMVNCPRVRTRSASLPAPWRGPGQGWEHDRHLGRLVP